jgi:flagellar biosynthetic protein FliP
MRIFSPFVIGILLCMLALAPRAAAQALPPTSAAAASTTGAPAAPPAVSINLGALGGAGQRGQIATGLQLAAILTVLSLAPAILIMVTSFTRIIVVLGFVRMALATQQVPPTQVLIGLALFLTFFVMAPTWKVVQQDALRPYFAGEIQLPEAFKRAEAPTRDFLFRNTRKNDLALFINMAKLERPQTKEDVPTHVLIPAFIVSELQTSFLIGFVIFIPFLIIDMVISSILLSMGMMMLPPVVVSLPFKIILFVLVDGWSLVVSSLVRSFG